MAWVEGDGAFATGSHIDLCAGCVPDDSVSLLLIDPVTLSPRSNVAEVLPSGGGLRLRSTALAGDKLLMAVNAKLHVRYEPSFAAFHCERE